MASQIALDNDGGRVRAIRALLESASDGTASITTDTGKPVFGKVYSWQVDPFSSASGFQPTNGFAVTIKDSDAISVVRAPTALNSISNAASTEATVLDANSLTAPFVVGNKPITFAATGMGSGKKAYVQLNVLA